MATSRGSSMIRQAEVTFAHLVTSAKIALLLLHKARTLCVRTCTNPKFLPLTRAHLWVRARARVCASTYIMSQKEDNASQRSDGSS